MEATKDMPAVEQDEHMSDRRIAQLIKMIEEADAIVVGGASGMSAAGGDSWYDVNPTYLKYYGDFYEKLGDRAGGIFPLLYYPFEEEGQRLLAMARTMHMVDEAEVPQQYWDLKELLEGKDFFVLTTNQDQLFRRVFGDDKTAFIQGDWGWLQCSRRCHDGLYSNKDFVERAMRNHGNSIVFLELGVGWRNQLVKQPMYQLALQEPNSAYLVFNMSEAVLPQGYQGEGIILEGDIASTVAALEERL